MVWPALPDTKGRRRPTPQAPGSAGGRPDLLFRPVGKISGPKGRTTIAHGNAVGLLPRKSPLPPRLAGSHASRYDARKQAGLDGRADDGSDGEQTNRQPSISAELPSTRVLYQIGLPGIGGDMSSRKPIYRKWRVGILASFLLVGAVGGFLCDVRFTEDLVKQDTIPLAWLVASLAIVVVVSPLISIGTIGIELVNPFSDETWELPTRDSHPLYSGNPLLPVHFLGQISIAQGIGHLLASLFVGVPALIYGVVGILFGYGLLLGLRWSLRFCKRKLSLETEHQSGAGR